MLMDDYIARADAVNTAYEYCHTEDGRCCGPSDVVELWEELKTIPAADVRPVAKAQILDMRYVEEDGEWKCSHCGWQYTLCVCGKDVTAKIHFCPNCGADMREES